MPGTGRHIWAHHPHVRSGKDLTVGERAADGLKHWMGTWTILGAVGAVIVFWLLRVHDPGELHLNLALSCMAAVQGIVLQIAANRGDRINAEAMIYLRTINDQQLQILTLLQAGKPKAAKRGE